MTFVFNDHSKEFGLGKESPERLKFSWETIADVAGAEEGLGLQAGDRHQPAAAEVTGQGRPVP